jgi:hypothetical protein
LTTDELDLWLEHRRPFDERRAWRVARTSKPSDSMMLGRYRNLASYPKFMIILFPDAPHLKVVLPPDQLLIWVGVRSFVQEKIELNALPPLVSPVLC